MELGEIRIARHHGRARQPNSKDSRIALIRDGADQDTTQPEESGFGQCLRDVTGRTFRPRQVSLADECGNQFPPFPNVGLQILDVFDPLRDLGIVYGADVGSLLAAFATDSYLAIARNSSAPASNCSFASLA
jgi:hypothetical protein